MNELDLFVAALEIPDPAKCAEYLDRECASNPALRQRIDALLAGNQQSRHPLDNPPSAPKEVRTSAGDNLQPTSDHPGQDEQAGAVIAGKYALVEVVGEGGMGSVWRAKQTEPVKRFVAVKLIKAGMDSKQVITRFEAERQALALMDHPNIAKVLDGGLHEHRPFFVMELVKGVPITEYCDRLKLPPQQRLELFVQVCQAIQHAHQKGIIHRDIKPSNVLIALYDDKPVVKVIDFGVAKATGGALTEHTIDTGFGGVVGTPQYMSPEQATFNNVDIDTRSDVYALGVLLYELLTGSTPFSNAELKKKGLLEILRVVREEEPPRPSTKLSTADALPSLSANRGTDPKKLTGLLRNELDWIVMKALEKDRTRRYETANGFAADVLRYLGGEAVQAHPPSTAYRMKKFVRRNKGQVIAASLVLLTLLAGVVGTSMGMVRAERSAEAERTAKLAAQDANDLTAERLKQIELINNSVFDIFAEFDIRKIKAVNDPVEAMLAKKLIETGRKLDEKAIQDPVVLAGLRHRLGITLWSLGKTEAAIKLFVQAREIRTAQLGTDHPDTLASLNELAYAYHSAGNRGLSLPLMEETVKLRKAKLGVAHRDTLTSMCNLADGYRDAGKLDVALPLYEETLKLQKATLGIAHIDTFTTMNNLAVAYQHAGKPDLAQPLLEETLRLQKVTLGADHPDTLVSMGNLASAYNGAGKLDLAQPLFEETLKLMKAKLGADHPYTLVSMGNLAGVYQDAGKLEQALPLLEETLKLIKAKQGADHPDTLRMMNNLASGYQAAGKLDLALPLYEETLKLRKAKLGTDHPSTLLSMHNLALGYWAAGKLDQALPLYEETLKLRTAKLGADHPETLKSKNMLALGYQAAGKLEKALPLLEETLKLRTAKLGADHPDTLKSMNYLLSAYAEAREQTKAIALFAEVRKRLPTDSSQLAGHLVSIGSSLLQTNAFAEAESLLRECLAIREKKEPDVFTTFNTQSLLGGALLGQKKYADAEPLLLKGYEGMKQREKTIPPQAATRLPEALDRLIELSTATNQPDEAKKWRAERAKYPAPTPKSPEKK